MFTLPLAASVGCLGGALYTLWLWLQDPGEIIWLGVAVALFSGSAFQGLRAWYWKRFYEGPERVSRVHPENPADGLEAAGWGSERERARSAPIAPVEEES